MKHILFGSLVLLLMAFTTAGQAADFTLREYLGHTWANERVTFPLTPAQTAKAEQKLALIGPDDREVPYQLLAATDRNNPEIAFQTDLAPLETRAYRFSDRSASAKTDLKIEESDSEVRIENELIGLAIRKTLNRGQGPIARIRLRDGIWTGDSSIAHSTSVKSYTAEIKARGPVFSEVLCTVNFKDGGHWRLRFRIESAEPVVLVEESFDAPGGGTFRLNLGDEAYQPTDLFFRSGMDGTLGTVMSQAIGTGNVFTLEPWLHWWESERQGNWFALYTGTPQPEGATDLPNDTKDHPAGSKKPDPHPDMLMIGLLRPSIWKDPNWSGEADQVGLKLPAQTEEGEVVAVSFPLGGGNRFWMLGTPDKEQSISVLAEKNRRVAPLPQQYLIKHGDFPLDVVKDYALEWPGDHDIYPRLFIGKADLPALRGSLESDPQQLKLWESQQAIDKYNIGDPLREYFASQSAPLGEKIIEKSSEWLDTVVQDDLLQQNGRVTLGVAPHAQAVLLLPTLNLTDAALGVASLTPELRQQLLAKLAFLGYAVNRDDYWSPAREFEANPNMTTTVALYQVALASLIPSHPMAKEWAVRGLETLAWQLDNWSDEDGGWLEAPHYALVAYDHMLAAFIMAERAGFANHLFDDRMRKVAEWLARISTPRDVHTDGYRHLPPIGNTYYGESTGMFCIVAGVWQKRDPEFAAQMQWMCEEHGSPGLGLGWSFPSMTGYTDLLKARSLAPEKPDYGSVWFKETGVVLRNKIGSDRETYLHLIAGANHEHYDYDSGSIVLWGKGRVLADDWGYIGRHGEEFHSLLSSPVNFGNMQITDFSTQAALDYVSGQKGFWQRQIAFVKDADPLGPNFFLIRDTNTALFPATWKLWLTVKTDSEGQPAIKFHPQGATVEGQDDVAFDLFFYQPDEMDLTTETATQEMSVGNRDGKVGPMTLTQTGLVASFTIRGTVTFLVYPRLKSEPSPKVFWHADGRIVELVSNVGSDYVCVAPQADSEDEFRAAENKLSFSGGAGSVQMRGKKVRLTLGSAGEIRFGDKSLTSDTDRPPNLLRHK